MMHCIVSTAPSHKTYLSYLRQKENKLHFLSFIFICCRRATNTITFFFFICKPNTVWTIDCTFFSQKDTQKGGERILGSEEGWNLKRKKKYASSGLFFLWAPAKYFVGHFVVCELM